jgi:aryl-alcohol dehydrogenase-like predicted oxidoreductase
MECPIAAITRGLCRRSRAGPLIRQALDLGINFFDTANTYSDGTSEEIVGRAIRILRAATKSCWRPRFSFR